MYTSSLIKSNVHIRKAAVQDERAVLALFSRFVCHSFDQTDKWKCQKQGFLLGEYTSDQFRKDVTSNLFAVAELSGKIIGYIRIDNEHEYKDNETKVWFSSDCKKEYFEDHHAEIGALAVDTTYKRTGIASALLGYVEEDLRMQNIERLFSIVALSPLTNLPSVAFHEKQGFERMAVSLPQTLFGFNHYQSVLYRKNFSVV